jgi:Cft2 family RNA processing exonuclease
VRIVPLGGADEVGASCLFVELANTRLLVDAGIRMHSRTGTGAVHDPLPDLARIKEFGGIQAILVTHAHADHIGALPLIHRAYPNVPIYATPATFDLMRVMLADSVKLMRQKAEVETDYPLYDEELVSSMLDQVVPVTGAFTVGEEVQVQPWRAGHILGAVMYGIISPEGSLCVTGDVLLSGQRTLPGAAIPRFNPDLLVMESTYGNRLHANRHEEERRLARSVAEVIARGGHVLIPAFALGRAQEVMLILLAHQEAGLIPTFPIWVDGMVRAICSVYERYPEELASNLRHAAKIDPRIFYSEKSTIRPVTDAATRERVLAGPPACIIASSGMLAGGASQAYALRLAGAPQHAIFLCGYQDEESPGRRLLKSIEEAEPTLTLDGQEVSVRCQIDRYGLSAHADMNALAAMVTQLRPRHVVIVHGEEEARQELAGALRQSSGVFLPVNGEELEFTYRRGKTSDAETKSSSVAGIGRGRSLDAEGIEELWKKLRNMRIRRPLASDEIAALWYGHAIPGDAVKQLIPMLEASPYFSPNYRQPWLFHVCRPDQVEVNKQKLNLLSEAQALPGSLLLVRNSMGELRAALCTDVRQGALELVTVGGMAADWPVESVLQWIGPFSAQDDSVPTQVADAQLALFRLLQMSESLVTTDLWRRILEVFATKGGEVTLDVLTDELLRQDSERNTHSTTREGSSAQQALRLAAAYLLNKLPERISRHAVGLLTVNYGLNNTMTDLMDLVNDVSDKINASGMLMADHLEQNAALTVVDAHLGINEGLYRRGLDLTKRQMNLYFLFPDIARQRLVETLEKIAARTGWSIHIHPEAHMGALTDQVASCLPAGCQQLRTPSVYREKQEVAVQCRVTGVTEEQLMQAGERFRAETGWQLVINGQTYGATSTTDIQLDEQGPDEDKFLPDPNSVPLEINRAFQVIRAMFADDDPVRLYKLSKKSDAKQGTSYIELSFISPQVGLQHVALIRDCAQDIGWELRINPEPNQNEIKLRIRQLMPAAWQLLREPSFFKDQQLVKVRLGNPPEDIAAWTEFHLRVKEATGYDVALA